MPSFMEPVDNALTTIGYRIALAVEGPAPSLRWDAGTLRAYLGRAAGGGEAQEVTIGASLVHAPMFSLADVPLRAPAEDDLQVVPLFARGTKDWLSVIETKRGASDAARRVRLVERDGTGRATVRATHEIWPAQEIGNAPYHRVTRNSPYDRAGSVAVVPLGRSVYGVAQAKALVLEGPGSDLELFREHDDVDCPPGKRCYPVPPTYDLAKLVGIAPDGSFVTLDGGIVLRVSERGTERFEYESFAFCGAATNDHVVLAHTGEPPHVTRWAAPDGVLAVPPPPPGSGPPEVRGVPTKLATGSFDALAEDTTGVVYGIRDDGALVRIDGERTGPLFEPPPGCRVGSMTARSNDVAFVVSCSMPSGLMRHLVAVHR